MPVEILSVPITKDFTNPIIEQELIPTQVTSSNNPQSTQNSNPQDTFQILNPLLTLENSPFIAGIPTIPVMDINFVAAFSRDIPSTNIYTRFLQSLPNIYIRRYYSTECISNF